MKDTKKKYRFMCDITVDQEHLDMAKSLLESPELMIDFDWVDWKYKNTVQLSNYKIAEVLDPDERLGDVVTRAVNEHASEA